MRQPISFLNFSSGKTLIVVSLVWILDQDKEKKPSDPTIAEKFNTYKFAEYKVHVIELIKKVTTVSVETMKIIREMEKIDN